MAIYEERAKQHQKIIKELHSTYREKNEKYGDSFVESVAEWGFSAAGVRITDKFMRMKGLMKSGTLEENGTDESLRDTLLDMANYCIMTTMILDEKSENKEEE